MKGDIVPGLKDTSGLLQMPNRLLCPQTASATPRETRCPYQTLSATAYELIEVDQVDVCKIP